MGKFGVHVHKNKIEFFPNTITKMSLKWLKGREDAHGDVTHVWEQYNEIHHCLCQSKVSYKRNVMKWWSQNTLRRYGINLSGLNSGLFLTFCSVEDQV